MDLIESPSTQSTQPVSNAYSARHARPSTTSPLMSGWGGRAVAVLAAFAVMISLVLYFDARADAATTPKRHVAMKYALAQKGDWYKYGATGPSRWDCSGLVMMAYRKAGISLPRTTYDMQSSRKLVRVSASRAKWGDIVFLSSGHVELYVKGGSNGWMFGAHHSGTKVGYKRIYNGSGSYPRFYHVRGAG